GFSTSPVRPYAAISVRSFQVRLRNRQRRRRRRPQAVYRAEQRQARLSALRWQMRERILITGPGGRVGTQIVPLLREHFSLRLLDVKPLSAESDDETVQADIRDFDALRAACAGVKAMVHLAAVPDEDDFHSRLLPMNLAGLYNAFEAARQAGVRKIIFASTGQTVLNYPRGQWVTPEMPVRPYTVYACTKVFGEALARY